MSQDTLKAADVNNTSDGATFAKTLRGAPDADGKTTKVILSWPKLLLNLDHVAAIGVVVNKEGVEHYSVIFTNGKEFEIGTLEGYDVRDFTITRL